MAHAYGILSPALAWQARCYGLLDPCELALIGGASLSEVMRIAASEAASRAVDERELVASGCDNPTVRAT